MLQNYPNERQYRNLLPATSGTHYITEVIYWLETNRLHFPFVSRLSVWEWQTCLYENMGLTLSKGIYKMIENKYISNESEI